MDWQEITALSIVLMTLLAFLIGIIRSKRNGGCGSACDCGKKED